MKIRTLSNKHLSEKHIFSEDMENSDIFRYLKDNLSMLDIKEKNLICTEVNFFKDNLMAYYEKAELHLVLKITDSEIVSKPIKEIKTESIDDLVRKDKIVPPHKQE